MTGAHRGAGRPRRGAGGRDRRLRHAADMAIASGRLRRRLRAAADRLDRPQRHLPLSADERARAVRRCCASSITHDHRTTARLQLLLIAFSLRRVLRGRGRLRHAGRGHRRDPDRPRLHAARRVRPVAHRQHRAGRLRRARHADHRAAERHRPRPAGAERDDRPAAAVLLGDRAVLAGRGPSPASAACSTSGRRSSSPASPSRSRSSSSRTFTARGWSTSSPRSSRWPRSPLFLRVWQPPATVWRPEHGDAADGRAEAARPPTALVLRAWTPWIILSVLVFVWGLPQMKAWLDSALDRPRPGARPAQPRAARAAGGRRARSRRRRSSSLNWLSATGTGILLAAMIAGLVMGYSLRRDARAPTGAR